MMNSLQTVYGTTLNENVDFNGRKKPEAQDNVPNNSDKDHPIIEDDHEDGKISEDDAPNPELAKSGEAVTTADKEEKKENSAKVQVEETTSQTVTEEDTSGANQFAFESLEDELAEGLEKHDQNMID